MKTWKTKDLLNIVFEFKNMVPNSDYWNQKSLKHNKPYLIRFKRIQALFKAFELTNTEKEKSSFWNGLKRNQILRERELIQEEIFSFLAGDFILKRETVVYPNIQKIIEKEKIFDSDAFKPWDIYSFYHHLMRYRIEIDNVLTHNSNVLEANNLGFRSAMSLTFQLNKDLCKKVEQIDEILSEIINPNNLTFEEDLLIDIYGFPKENLGAIDIGNY